MRENTDTILEIKIMVKKDNSVVVQGFPNNYMAAVNLLQIAEKNVIEFFVNKALAGKLDPAGSIINNKIINPEKPIILMGAKQHLKPC